MKVLPFLPPFAIPSLKEILIPIGLVFLPFLKSYGQCGANHIMLSGSEGYGKGRIFIRLVITGLMVFFIKISAYSQEHTITGAWQTDFAGIISEMSPEKKEKYDSLKQEVKSRAEKSLSNRIYEFFEDGRVTAFWSYDGREISYNGTWEITAEGDLSVSVGEKVVVYVIVYQNNSKVTLRPKNGPKDLILNTLVLKRI